MMQKYIWQDDNWPHFYWDSSLFADLLAEVNVMRGNLLGMMSVFGYELQSTSMLDSLTQEIVHSSEIEGERLNHDSVRSSVARQLGIELVGTQANSDHYTEGVVQVMLDATQNCNNQLTADRLFNWHAALFPTGRSGMYAITVADWRKGDEPMQVVSGAMGKEKVHYVAPQSNMVPTMMNDFINWIENSGNTDPVVKAAIAHLWFVSIHPFDDGNGRLCRTITEMLLSRADGTSKRYYSLSSEILNNRNAYYDILERTQKSGMDVTSWIIWFLYTLKASISDSLGKAQNIVRKVAFWDEHRDTPINERQRKIINKLFDGFDGKLNTSKWAKINHCSQDTASRDIKDLISKSILQKTAENGRNTNYELCCLS